MGVDVRQAPPALLQSPGDEVQLVCSHLLTDYKVMLWYLQPPGQTDLKLIGSLDYSTVTLEKRFDQNFSVRGDLSGDDAKNVSLVFQVTAAEDGARFYCAARFARRHETSLALTRTVLTVSNR